MSLTCSPCIGNNLTANRAKIMKAQYTLLVAGFTADHVQSGDIRLDHPNHPETVIFTTAGKAYVCMEDGKRQWDWEDTADQTLGNLEELVKDAHRRKRAKITHDAGDAQV